VKNAVAANIKRANAYAETMAPIIEEIRDAHVHSLREIAKCLTARGFKTPNGKAFAAQSVKNILERTAANPSIPACVSPKRL
jgi:hypothetical protein